MCLKRLISLITMIIKATFHCNIHYRAVISVWSSTVERVKTGLISKWNLIFFRSEKDFGHYMTCLTFYTAGKWDVLRCKNVSLQCAASSSHFISSLQDESCWIFLSRCCCCSLQFTKCAAVKKKIQRKFKFCMNIRSLANEHKT